VNVLISGAGIAGLTLAFWLVRNGHAVTLVEKSPALRDEGYMIDFAGSGYDVAEKMGLLPDLETIHYPIPRLAFVDARGREKFSVGYAALRRLADGRHFNFMRGDLQRVLYAKVRDDIRLLFGTTAESFRQEGPGARVSVQFSDGATGEFDLLVGADGVHSPMRQRLFGEEGRFSRFLGYYTAAFILADRPRAVRPDALYTLTVPGRQVGVYPIRGERVATFFFHKAQRPVPDFSVETAVRELRTVYGGLDWVVPELLERCDRTGMYFDEVAQIELPRWSAGRVVLVGDACQCVSLLAGQGASMAMAGAYILAEELAAAGGDLPGALRRYEEKVKPAIEKQQRAGRRMAGWFVPDNQVRLVINDLLTRMVEWPVAWRLLRRLMAPESIIRA
jgi:2-polyprenyl-6-methoxyphenol hydroxylase-like FAD-dependent oxidoreductase